MALMQSAQQSSLSSDPYVMTVTDVSNENKYIKIAALDHRGSLKKIMEESFMSPFKKLCTETFAPYSTAILVDPEYGEKAIQKAKENRLGILLSREISGYKDNPDGRITELYPQFDSKKLKDMGATAIKLLLYYNHEASNAPDQIKVLERVKQEADEVNLPVLLEPIVYPTVGVPFHKGDATMRAIQDLRDYSDVLKLEFPIDIKNNNLESAIPYLDQITMEANQPWVLLSRGMPFETYKQALQLSKTAGASGYAVGRAVWQEVASMKSWQEIETFITVTAKNKMAEISGIFA